MKNLFRISAVILLILSISLTHSCKKDKPAPTPPIITTTAASSITQTTATSGGNVTSDGGASVTARGVCWSTTTGPTTALSTKTTDNTGTGIFTSSITALTAGTVYYVKAYATNSAGTAYGNEISFTTTAAATVPVLTTTAASSITQTTATSGGNVTSDGGASVTARGVCWSTTTGPPTALSTKTTDNTGTGIFTSSITALTAGTVYYVKAYATNSAGTAYGNEISFTTTAAATVPVLTTTAASSITQTTATSGGNVTSDGGASVTARGVCWSTTTGPPTALSTKTTDNTGTGIFTSSITALTAGTVYYVKAYATNSAGTAYGNEISFTTTAAATVPVLTTTAASSITQTTATSGGNVTSDGGASVTARGVCWSTTTGPTTALSTKTTDNTGTGIFTSSITGLTGGIVYYVRAYATNSVGTGYGNQVSFTTLTIPTVSTTAITIFTSTSATVGGNVTADGGVTVTERGVYWGISQNPESTGARLQVGGGTGSFSSSLTGLSPNTTYYVTAYAINSVGAAFGNQQIFSTDPIIVNDIDGNIYDVVRIGSQIFMAENLKTTKYDNGDLIGTTTPATLDISGETTPKYQWAYAGDESNVATYGRLYTWYAATDSRSVCPTGWHVPSNEEWVMLQNTFGGSIVAGSKMKEAGFSHWIYPNEGADNSSGFNALPGGLRYGTFNFITMRSNYWSSHNYSTLNADYYELSYEYTNFLWGGDVPKTWGMSIRCLKD